ncbi:PQQ-dependent sugar dehydrogenase [Sphingobacterium thalpophilum]|uniref:PQQ-dependent sugar dehydrogenase n=1 Tax=Sphingobacterium thalpophilum TaxID=259 RepID=A0ABV4HG30_9SPHI|nr:PQQ-dependent sugar dehydrogenase [Sphingobacterium thalpophilum]
MRKKIKYGWLLILLPFLHGCYSDKEKETPVINSIQLKESVLSLSKEASGLRVPWDLQYDRVNQTILFSEIDGSIRKLDIRTKRVSLVDSLKDVYHQRTLGLLGMSLYQPEGGQAFLYLSYTSKRDSLIFSNLYRYHYSADGKLSNPKLMLQIPGNTGHNGSRVIVSTDEKVYWATGDAANDTFAQDSSSLNGKILRLNLDGSIPADNPIPNSYIYAWGFRNMQGLTYNAKGTIYSSEHGDAIEDEINLIQPLKNYGWPQIEGKIDTEKEKAIAKRSPRTEPIKSWTPVVAPSGMAYYGLQTIPEWQNSLILATLKNQSLRILKLSADGKNIIDEQILFKDQLGRLRSVLVLPNGDIYFCSSNRDWNPQKGFPKADDDVIYRLRLSDRATAPVLKPQAAGNDALEKKNGQVLYDAYCASCHKADGKGLTNTFPPLAQSKLVNGNPKTLLKLLLHGLKGQKVQGIKYEGAMPAFAFLKDEEIIELANYIRTHFGNKATTINQQNLTSLR